MIVPMRKVTLVALDRRRAESLRELRRVGVMHVEIAPGVGAGDGRVEELREHRSLVARALGLLAAEKGAGREGPGPAADPIDVAREVDASCEKEQAAAQERARLARLVETLEPWGDFDPSALRALAEKGVSVRLITVTPAEAKRIPRGVLAIELGEAKGRRRLAVVSRGGAEDESLPGAALALPDMGLEAARAAIARLDEETRRLQGERAGLACHAEALRRRLAELDRALELERVALAMGGEGPLVTLTGFVPRDRVADLEEAAARGGWAMLVEEPAEDDPVPTLIRNPAWIRTIRPVLSFLGTVPGYGEYDISPWFLIFFSVFWAMIVGDAAYGLIYLGLAIWARARLPKMPRELFRLIALTSTTTVIYGAITGTWFGSRALAEWPPLHALTINAVASYPRGGVDSTATLMGICFVIGAVHLTLAHTINFLRKLPSLAALQEPGWLSVLWGMYFAIQILVMKKPDSTPVASWGPLASFTFGQAALALVVSGLVLIVLFGEQKGHVARGFLMGLAWLPLKLLNSVSTFADTVSYVRLFAVGFAGAKVGAAVNAMCAGLGQGFPAIAAAALIAVVGHGLNLVLGSLSLIVHGVRLNVLEFSNHLGLEWKGTAYSPFREG
jgi:V/A-type H+-transporting ATPase subunit I